MDVSVLWETLSTVLIVPLFVVLGVGSIAAILLLLAAWTVRDDCRDNCPDC